MSIFVRWRSDEELLDQVADERLERACGTLAQCGGSEVNASLDAIESRLEESPTEWGEELAEDLHSFSSGTVRVLFYVIEPAKVVRIVAAIPAIVGEEGMDDG